MIFALQWIFIVLTAAAAVIQFFVAGKSPNPDNLRWPRLLVILLFLATLASFFGSSLERERDLNKVLESIQRSLDQFTDVSVSFQATVPASEVEVAAFRDRLIKHSELCLLEAGGSTPATVAPGCLPDLEREQAAYRRLGTLLLSLDFHRVSGTGSKTGKADWSMGFSSSLHAGTLALEYDRQNDLFILSGAELKPFHFEAPGNVLSVADLESGEVDVVIRLRSDIHGRLRETEPAAFEVVNIYVKGAHTWARRITHAQTVRQTEPYPGYRYRIAGETQ